ncbi:hypothetical protein ASD56_14525 [Microbacterium sp. Root166]|nr:hypothetical protein ASD56_14525 [Microbacterium sp. Root166]
MGVSAAIAAIVADVGPPLTPDGDEAREWAERELADPVYDAAEPTPFDLIARAIADAFSNLFSVQLGEGWGSAAALLAAIVVVVAIVVAFAIWGVPRATGRARQQAPALFDADERRSAAQLRAAAAAHAEKAEWDAAVAMRFRALARACAERGVVDVPPGATVHAFARAAARAFPGFAERLESSATAFDDVRYLRRPGTPELYRLVAETDDAVAAARPAQLQETSA